MSSNRIRFGTQLLTRAVCICIAFIAAIGIVSGCSNNTARAGKGKRFPTRYKSWQTDANPLDLALDARGLWFPYGMNVDGTSGVGLIAGGRAGSALKSGSSFEVDNVASDGRGSVWFAAKGDSGNVTQSVVGIATPRRLRTIATFRGRWVAAIAPTTTGQLFILFDRGREYATTDKLGRIRWCRLPPSGGQASHGGTSNLVTNGSAFWLYDAETSSIFRILAGCETRRLVAHVDPLIGLAAASPGVWGLSAQAQALVLFSAGGTVNRFPVPSTAQLTAVGIVRNAPCVASASPTAILCLNHGTWNVRSAPLQGRISSLLWDSRSASLWLGYESYQPGGYNEGAIVKLSGF